jgi:hypothetical protein
VVALSSETVLLPLLPDLQQMVNKYDEKEEKGGRIHGEEKA